MFGGMCPLSWYDVGDFGPDLVMVGIFGVIPWQLLAYVLGLVLLLCPLVPCDGFRFVFDGIDHCYGSDV